MDDTPRQDNQTTQPQRSGKQEQFERQDNPGRDRPAQHQPGRQPADQERGVQNPRPTGEGDVERENPERGKRMP